ncbi:MAG: sigma-54-dependent Fis family transcriptional regulator [Deltaproteobacteria bacterium]|nr:sigma-54-dependent Fis family transcriptional regulator [Candidatus Zymogenaceae bacterium]
MVVSSDHITSQEIVTLLQNKFSVDIAPDIPKSLVQFEKKKYDLLFLDVTLLETLSTERTIKSVINQFREISRSTIIAIMTRIEHNRRGIMAIKAGADNYISIPIQKDELNTVIQSIYDTAMEKSKLDYLSDTFWDISSQPFLNTKSPPVIEVIKKIKAVAPTKSTVLLIGETGTGKGVLSQLIHKHSHRRDAPFIQVHLGAIPDTLVESELFGHEKGSFTGAIRRKLGKFELASDGTIFLDEIETVSPHVQIRLLQVLQDGTYYRVGGEEPLSSSARVIAATNIDLITLCEQDLFRYDLYYRLNVFPIEIPSLKYRTEDIPTMVHTILERLNRFHEKSITDVHPDVLEAFTQYSWPGNIRELENFIERAYLMETTDMISPEHFPREFFSEKTTLEDDMIIHPGEKLASIRERVVRNAERRYLIETLSSHNGSIQKTADTAGITTRQLFNLMQKHNIRKEDFK